MNLDWHLSVMSFLCGAIFGFVLIGREEIRLLSLLVGAGLLILSLAVFNNPR